MSTAQNPTFSFPSETGVSGDGGGDDGGLGSRGANYFFGFLITFVVLLLIFIVCGICSRRRFLARRNAMLMGAYEPWGQLSKDGTHFQTQPALYEKTITEPVLDDQWCDTMPLSATYRPGQFFEADQDAAPGNYDHEPRPSQPYNLSSAPDRQGEQHHARGLSERVRSWIPGIPQRKRSVDEASENEKGSLHAPDSVDVAVMIAMPAQPQPQAPPVSLRSDAEKASGEEHAVPVQHLHIGTATLPWPAGLVVLPLNPLPAPTISVPPPPLA